MGQTIVEKIIAHNMGAKQVKPGEIVTVSVDRVMLDDIMIPFIADKFHEMGFGKIWNPDKAVLIYDHLVPSSQLDDTRHYKVGDEFAEKYGIEHVHRSDAVPVHLRPLAQRPGSAQRNHSRQYLRGSGAPPAKHRSALQRLPLDPRIKHSGRSPDALPFPFTGKKRRHARAVYYRHSGDLRLNHVYQTAFAHRRALRVASEPVPDSRGIHLHKTKSRRPGIPPRNRTKRTLKTL